MRNHEECNALQQHVFMQDMLERISDGFFAVDKNWKVILWNKEAETLLKTRRNEVLGRKLWDCFPVATQLKYFTHYQKAVQQQVPVHFEEFYPPLQLRTDVFAYPSEQGLSVYFRRADERDMQSPNDGMLASMVKKTIHAVSVVDADGKISWVNDAFTRFTGYSFSEAVGRRQTDLVMGPETDTGTIEEMRQAFSKRLPFYGRNVIYTRDKQKKWVATSGQPLLHAQETVCMFFLIQTDVTAQQDLISGLQLQQQTTTAAIIEAQEKERTHIGQELHDNVNQVLTSVKLYVELCLAGPEQQKELLRRSASLLQEVIDDIRSISHQLASPRLGTGCLADSIKELATRMTTTGKFKVKLHMAAIEKLSTGEKLHLAVYRILQEHFTNVLKHAGASTVEVYAYTEHGDLVLKLRDDGRGFNVHEKKPGLGLLSIRNRAESVNGSLVINSKPGLGCVLIVRIPLVP